MTTTQHDQCCGNTGKNPYLWLREDFAEESLSSDGRRRRSMAG